jgi:hypothetical protein
MAVSAIGNPTPKRLLRTGGRWVLEIESLVPFRENILRPMTQRVEGEDGILFHLENTPDGKALASSATRLLRSAVGSPSDERAFEPSDGTWVPALPKGALSARGAAAPATLSAPAGPAVSSAELTAVQRDLSMMGVAQDRLAKRVGHIEKKPDASILTGELLKQLAALTEANERLAARVALLEDRLSRGDIAAPARIAPPLAVPVVAPSPPIAIQAVPPAPVSVPELPSDGPFEIAPIDEFASSLVTLLGLDGGKFNPAKRELKANANLRDCYISKLLDDDGKVVGAFLSDMKATIFLGGSLMMLPEGELKDQLRNRAPSEDVVSALSETFNTLSGIINMTSGNPHVRTTPTERFDFAKEPWTAHVRARLDLEDPTGGRTAVLAR